MRNAIVTGRAAAPLDFLAAPAPTFNDPGDVLARVDLPIAERRAILAAWASDARAVEDAPRLRQLESGARIAVSDVLAALRRLDAEAREPEGFVAPGFALARRHEFPTLAESGSNGGVRP